MLPLFHCKPIDLKKVIEEKAVTPDFVVVVNFCCNLGSLNGASNGACFDAKHVKMRVQSGSMYIPGREAWQPSPVFFLEESMGRKSGRLQSIG